MSETSYAKCSSFFVIAFLFLFLFVHFCTSAPVENTENAYTQFIAELNRNKCSVPSQVQLPFDTSKVNNLEYLSSYLEICRNTETTKRNKEAVVLCKEIFDNIRNISCPTKTALPDISVQLSENVCLDIGALKESVPEDDKSLLKRLTDKFLCDMMCDSEFERACQVLFWSFEVRKQIASVASVQEPEQPNMLEDEGDVNGVNKQSDTMDSLKKVDENIVPEISINPQNKKQNAEETKGVNPDVGHDGIAEVPDSSKLEDNPEQKPDNPSIPSEKGKQDPLPSDQGEIQSVPKTSSQDSIGATKSASGLQTPISLAQQKPSVQTSNSNTEDKPVEETEKGELNDQNTNKQLQGDVTKHNKVINAGGELSQGSNSDVFVNEPTQGVNIKANLFQDKKDTSTPANGHPQDNSYTPTDQNTPVKENNNVPGNEIPDETPEKIYQNSNHPYSNDYPHESGNEKSPNDAAADLHDDEQKPSNLVHTSAGNEPQNTVNNDSQSGKKTDAPTTGSQTTKDATQQQTAQEVTQDQTSVARDETTADQAQTNSVSTKVITQDLAKTGAMTPDFVTDDKKPNSAPKTEEFDNTIPDATGGSIITGEETPEKSEKSKPTSENPNGKSVVPSSLAETSTKTTVALEKMEGGSDLRQPADEGDHYGDLENTEDDEYSRPEYGDGGLFEVSKSKVSNPDVPSPIYAAKEIITSQNDRPVDFSSRNVYGQDSSNIQMISSFPDQEDGHFFFYFLSIVLILMAGYLIFHNKQKIIALIVEGRHERNRRSHRVGYKKLETK